MKIAVVHNLPPGGQKRALHEQMKRLSNRHIIDLYTLSSTNEDYLPLKPFIRHHITVPYSYPEHFPLSVLSIYILLPRAYRMLAEKINHGGYDAAYVCPCYLTQAPYILRYLKIPSLYSCAEPKREFYEKIPRASNSWTYRLTYPFRLPIRSIDRENTRKATGVLSISQFEKVRIDRIYGISSKLLYLGTDAELFRPQGTKKENFVLSVGVLSLHKGHDFLIRSLAEIPPDNRPKLVIVGSEGAEKIYLEKLAGKYQVELEIKVNVTDKELVSLYNRAGVFVYAAHDEPFGLAVLEALSCGTRVVAVDEGGIGEIIKDNRLGIVTSRSEKSFSRGVSENMKNDPFEERKSSNRWVRRNWNWESSVRELEKYLEEIVRHKD